MHGLGNDFVVIDSFAQEIQLTAEQIRFIADRHFGIGCDQLLLLAPSDKEDVDVRYMIYNSDGGEVGVPDTVNTGKIINLQISNLDTSYAFYQLNSYII